MGKNPGTFFPGETGGLTVDSLGQIRRQLLLAQFTGSGPEVRNRMQAAADKADVDDEASDTEDESDPDASDTDAKP